MIRADKKKSWEDLLDAELKNAAKRNKASSSTGTATLPKPTTTTHDVTAVEADIDADLTKQQIYSAIREGCPLPVDIYDEKGRFLLGAGSTITPEFLELLRGSGIKNVRFRPATVLPKDESTDEHYDPARAKDLHTDHSTELDDRLAGELLVPIEFRSVAAWRRPKLSILELKREAGRGVQAHAAAANCVADLCETLNHGKRISAPQLNQTIDQFLLMAAVDFDLLPLILAMQSSGDEYLYDHCVNVSLLCMAIASQMALDREHTIMLSLGGLLVDMGMMRVPLGIRMAERELTQREWHEIRRHPLHTLDMLADIRGIPQTVKYMAYQHHERCDGSGYPRGKIEPQLHSFSKIVSVADAYAAKTCDRPHRKAMKPYDAAKWLLQEGAQGKFDRIIIRALLDTISLFPIGSKVGLSDGTTARVLRAVPGLHTRPVVEELSEEGMPTGNIIDLSQTEEIKVIKTLSDGKPPTRK